MTTPSPPAAASAVLVVATVLQGRSGLLDALGRLPLRRPFEPADPPVWAGVPADGASVVAAVRLLLRAGVGSVGIGCGVPGAGPGGVPGRSGASRRPAYVAARAALAAAHRSRYGVAVRAGRGRGCPVPPLQDVQDAETCLWLLANLWRRRSPEGWAVTDLMETGLTGRDCARELDISPSAVSQRAAAARYDEGRRATGLAGRLLDGLVRPR